MKILSSLLFVSAWLNLRGKSLLQISANRCRKPSVSFLLRPNPAELWWNNWKREAWILLYWPERKVMKTLISIFLGKTLGILYFRKNLPWIKKNWLLKNSSFAVFPLSIIQKKPLTEACSMNTSESTIYIFRRFLKYKATPLFTTLSVRAWAGPCRICLV